MNRLPEGHMTRTEENLSITESKNQKTMNIDRMNTQQILEVINQEDNLVPMAVQKEIPKIAKAVDMITNRIQAGGRLVYCGAGTSGRMGIVDAVECVPTFGLDEGRVVAIIAGGNSAMFRAREGAEDNGQFCVDDLKAIDFNEKDTLIGIAASGRTPYVLAGMEYARSIDAVTIALCCNSDSALEQASDIAITPIVGAEVIAGSTRMKAGTAQKLVLNMISTSVMIKLGKVYGNLMVDLKVTNNKLVERAKRIVMESTNVDYETAQDALEKSGYHVKLAILMLLAGIDSETGMQLLQESQGHLRPAVSKGIHCIEKAGMPTQKQEHLWR